MSKFQKSGTLMLYALHRTAEWWRFLGRESGWENSFVVSEIRGDGDVFITNDFYNALGNADKSNYDIHTYFKESELQDIVARCRVLRWLNRQKAVAMVNAMATVFEELLLKHRPTIIVSFPIDRYVTDVLERIANRAGIPFLELTASVFSKKSMLLQRGEAISLEEVPDIGTIKKHIDELVDPTYVAAYVPKKRSYTAFKFIRTLGYFKLRGIVFKFISLAKRDKLGLHYLDAGSNLGHKCRWKDIRILGMIDSCWEKKLQDVPKESRVLFGLQLFPEASIDYWIKDLGLIEHENMLLEAIETLSNSGYTILIKDHPLQFGFRHTGLLKKALETPNVLLIPYEVPSNFLLSLVGSSFNCTGTPGLQAALLGLTSIVTESYYSNRKDFIVFDKRSDISSLPNKISEKVRVDDLESVRYRISSHLLSSSFEGDLFTFNGFLAGEANDASRLLAKNLGKRLDAFLANRVALGREPSTET